VVGDNLKVCCVRLGRELDVLKPEHAPRNVGRLMWCMAGCWAWRDELCESKPTNTRQQARTTRRRHCI